MEKKNTILLMVIAIATLLVAVVGATFAYFAVADPEGNMVVNVTTPASAATLEAQGTELNLVITADHLQQAGATNEEGKWLGENMNKTSTLTVTLRASAENVLSKCSYHLLWTWDGSAAYRPTTGIPEDEKEFTVMITRDADEAFDFAGDVTSAGNKIVNGQNYKEVAGSKKVVLLEETQISELNGFNSNDNGSFKLTTVKDSISSKDAGTGNTLTYDVEVKFYNLSIVQNPSGEAVSQAGKNYKAKVSLTDVVC